MIKSSARSPRRPPRGPDHGSGGGRLDWIDALRGLAALLVVVQHSLERLAPGFRAWTTTHLALGQLGVTVFFLVSGLVVPVSLERAGTLKGFWRSRFFRLWPAYWVSLLAVVAVHHLGFHPYPPHAARVFAVDATMVQAFVGEPNLLGVYWTLAFELAFYVAISLLWRLGLLPRSVGVAVVACAGAVALVVLGRLTSHHVPLGIANGVTMLVGAVMWRRLQGEVGRRAAWTSFALGAVTSQVVLAVELAGRPVDSSTPDVASWRAFAVAWVLAYAVVALAIVGRHRRASPVLVRVGLWSYALYLFHPIAFDALHDAPGPWPVVAVQWVALSMAIAAVVHRTVERPAIALGRRRRVPSPARPV